MPVKFRAYYCIILGLLMTCMMSVAHAAVDDAFNWLAAQQNSDGGVYSSTDIANPAQATYEILELTALTGDPTPVDTAQAIVFLASGEEDNTEYLSQRLMSGIMHTADALPIVDRLKTRQYSQGGFGDFNGYVSTPYDTFWALAALKASGHDAAIASQAISYLLDQQKADGSWSISESSDVYLTARILYLLTQYRTQFALESAILSANHYLLNQVNAEQLLSGDVFYTAAGLLALSLSMSDVSTFSGMVEALKAKQLANGSWENDVFTTALAIRALHIHEARNSSQDLPLGTVTGRVVMSGSTEPLSEVQISVVGISGGNVSSDPTGAFVISGLEQGDYTLMVSRNGYQTVSIDASVNAQIAINLGDIPLAIVSNAAAFSGFIYDDATQSPLQNVQLLLTGSKNYPITTNSNGSFLLNHIDYGDYQLSLAANGYHDLSISLAFDKALTYKISQGMVALGQVLDDQPASLFGTIVDGETGSVLSDVTLELTGVGPGTSDATGGFNFANVARGEYQLSASATGYVNGQYSFHYPAGSAGNLGSLALYPQAEEAPTSITLNVTVSEAVSKQTIAGASVTVGGQTLSTDASGKVQLENISLLELDLSVQAEGYLANQQKVTLSGYGSYHIAVALTPAGDPSLTLNTVSGLVVDENGEPIEGATIEVVGLDISSVSSADGHYALADIDGLTFTVRAIATGFEVAEQKITVAAFGHYALTIPLNALLGDVFSISQLKTPTGAMPANSRILIDAVVENVSSVVQSGLIRGQVFDLDGKWIADMDAYTPGTENVGSAVEFAVGESISFTIPWNNRQTPAGEYTVRIAVVEPGTMSQSLPTGKVYIDRSGSVSIADTMMFEGGYEFDPALSQAGQETPVQLDAIVKNTGNVPVAAGNYTLTITSEEGDALYDASTFVNALAINQVVDVQFGEWVPSVAGHLNISITHNDYPDIGEISGIYYVGDLAVGEFTLDQAVFPEGTHQTTGHIRLTGVDVTQGSSVDPLFVQVRNAVTKGGQYVGQQGEAWHKRNRCSGCHIQTQSLFGLAASVDKADIDEKQLTFLYNTIAGSQHPDGNLYISHGSKGAYQKTLALLGAWSLTAWNDWQEAYRTKYQAMQYLWSRRSSSGNQTWWTRDHNTGWLVVDHEAATAIASQVIVDLLENAEALSEQPLDYTVGEAIPLNQSKGQARGMTEFEGHLYITKKGGIEKLDPATGHSELIYNDAKNRDFIDILVQGDGTIYAATFGEILKIGTDGNVSEHSVPGSNIRGIVEWDNAIYISDYKLNRIWRFNPKESDESIETFASGGLLSSPHDMVVDSEGHLLVVNHQGFNVIRIDRQGNQSVYADGLPFKPFKIIAAGNNEYYLTTDRFYIDKGYTPYGISLLKQDKTLEVLVNHRGYHDVGAVYGLGLVNGTLYFVDNYANEVRPVNSTPLDDSLIPLLKNELAHIANYFLARYQSDTDYHIRNAFTLIGLAELATMVEDNALLEQINSAIDSLETLLRAAQRVDGGWAHVVNYSSDPLATAWIGIALDYTNPSADDPMVRNAITYLLNQQSGDGSWYGRYLSQSRLGSSGMVMAYMPTALERLGGLDVDLDVTMPVNVGLLNPTVLPDQSIQNPDGSIHYLWTLEGVTANGQSIDFDLNIENLLLNETRAVATSATLTFENSLIENEKIIRDMTLPHVKAVSELVLQTTTDQSAYYANENVAISNLVNNGGMDFDNGRLMVTMRTSQGGVIETIEDQTAINLFASTNQTYPLNWNTARYPAGDYQAFVQVVDQQGRVQAESVADFMIFPSTGQDDMLTYSTSIHTDKPQYLPYDVVQLNSRVRNLAVNVSQKPVLTKIKVRDPNGADVFSRHIVIPEMGPVAILDYQDTLNLVDATVGIYTAAITLWNADVTQPLASYNKTFEVMNVAVTHLTGTVSVNASRVERGDAISCTDTVTNQSATLHISATIDKVLVAVDGESVIQISTEELSLTAQQNAETIRQIDTTLLEDGGYACLLQAVVNGERVTLDYQSFVVVVPPIELAIAQGVGERGRLLILLDAIDYHDNLDQTPVVEQAAYLRALLDSEGWSYTIVHNPADFTREFYSGQYIAYALMSNRETLEPQVEEVLAEAVNRGEGLLINGAFNRRNNKIEKAIGVGISGREQQASGVVLAAGSLGEDWQETTLTPAIKYDIDRCEADMLAYYTNVSKQGKGKGDKPQSTCTGDVDTEAAVVRHHYGLGQSLFIAFDALDEATMMGDSGNGLLNNPYGELLKYAFKAIHPQNNNGGSHGRLIVPLTTGNAIPLVISVQNLGIEVMTRLRLQVPDNAVLVDGNGWTMVEEGGVDYWQYTQLLAEQTAKTTTVHIQLLDDQLVTLPIQVATRVDNGIEWVLYDEQPTVFEMKSATVVTTMMDVENAMAGLLAMNAKNKNYKHANTHVSNAASALASGDVYDAIHKLLMAADYLAEEIEVGDADAGNARFVLDALMLSLVTGLQ